jgi:hypothetical protein
MAGKLAVVFIITEVGVGRAALLNMVARITALTEELAEGAAVIALTVVAVLAVWVMVEDTVQRLWLMSS